MKVIQVIGTFLHDGYQMRNISITHDDKDVTDEVRNTVYNVLRRLHRKNDYLLWDDGEYVTFDDGTRIII